MKNSQQKNKVKLMLRSQNYKKEDKRCKKKLMKKGDIYKELLKFNLCALYDIKV